jgi:hypothetical protein
MKVRECDRVGIVSYADQDHIMDLATARAIVKPARGAMTHCANGRPKNNDVRITDPGPPATLIGLAGEPLAST